MKDDEIEIVGSLEKDWGKEIKEHDWKKNK